MKAKEWDPVHKDEVRVYWDDQVPGTELNPSVWKISVEGNYITFYLADSDIPLFTIDQFELVRKANDLRSSHDAINHDRRDHSRAQSRRR